MQDEKLKPYIYTGIINEQSRWFLKWLTVRSINKKLAFENGQLKSEIKHLEYFIETIKK